MPITIRKCPCGCGFWQVVRPNGSVYAYAPGLRKAFADARRLRTLLNNNQ